MAKSKYKIHSKIKLTLGYDSEISDDEFLENWKERSTHVCKPCWELKYCPYGPFVEQSPLLPITRGEAIKHNQKIKHFLESGCYGLALSLDAEEKELYSEVIAAAKKDPSVLAKKVGMNLYMEELSEIAEKEGKDIFEYLQPPMSDFERYKVPFPFKEDKEEIKITDKLKIAIEEEINRMEQAVSTGIDDQREPLDASRRKLFKKEVSDFNPNDCPETIPDMITDMQCNKFAHICPVVFVGESITETTEERRRGRYISFTTKVRVVRRDNYTCQICGKHLKDHEVEFDHIIAHAKGGSSEEHNIRLTCFDCNREKSDRVEI
ncbi:hypothetical protein MNBD_DELTA01-2077 [hydrothermal vent metagenome]|uniref:C2H2-type domain-containing protein n=1 Tax=hydrothermal vent metagenome TaxID=652676 RepID=A0A3B0QPD1_9ZZZZ